MIDSATGGMRLLRRSDAVLEPLGGRIGAAGIYNLVEQLPEVADSLAIGRLEGRSAGHPLREARRR